MNYILSNLQGAVLASNISSACKACLQACSARTEIFKCRKKHLNVRRGMASNQTGVVRLCTDSNIKSTKLFKRILNVYLTVLPVVDKHKQTAMEEANVLTNRLVHNVVTYNAHILQAIYALVGQEELARVGSEQVNLFKECIDIDRNKSAMQLLRILKNANLMKTEFSVFNKLYDRAPAIDMYEHEIHRIVSLVFNSFWLDFVDKKVKVRIGECREKVLIDYESTAAAISHIVDNATKYIAQNGTLDVEFRKQDKQLTVVFDMLSLKIEPDEAESIFNEGYSGRIPRETNLAGKGVGLFMVKEMLRLNNASIKCTPNVSGRPSFDYNNFPYEHNRFEIIFEKQT